MLKVLKQGQGREGVQGHDRILIYNSNFFVIFAEQNVDLFFLLTGAVAVHAHQGRFTRKVSPVNRHELNSTCPPGCLPVVNSRSLHCAYQWKCTGAPAAHCSRKIATCMAVYPRGITRQQAWAQQHMPSWVPPCGQSFCKPR